MATIQQQQQRRDRFRLALLLTPGLLWLLLFLPCRWSSFLSTAS